MSLGRLALRCAFAASTALAVLVSHVGFVNEGSSRDYGGWFVFWLVLALIPSCMYASVSRDLVTTVVCGLLLVSVTTVSWLIAYASTNEFAIGIPALGVVFSYGVATWALVDPLRTRRAASRTM